MMQVDNLEKFLAWVRSSPCQFTVSSMSGGLVHVKFIVPCDKSIGPNEAEQFYKSYKATPVEDRDELMNKCYEDGFRDGRREYADVEGIELPEFYLNELDKPVGDILGDDDKYRKGHADGVQEVIAYAKSELDNFGR